MLDHKGFDLWADGYDKAVGISDEKNSYPFAGYKEILGRIYQIIMEKPGVTVLDIGFGTGTLTTKLYENGCIIYGQDFSSRMIELASAKMPEAHLFQGDIINGLVVPLLLQRYDFIVATVPGSYSPVIPAFYWADAVFSYLSGEGENGIITLYVYPEEGR